MKKMIKWIIVGVVAGAVNGTFGTGGGMLLVPLLTIFRLMEEEDVFSASVSIILPICVVSLTMSKADGFSFIETLPYLIGGCIGGVIAGLTGNKIPVKWLHRILGIFVLWGGYRYLC